jgi:uncharacterized OsmC-like protein
MTLPHHGTVFSARACQALDVRTILYYEAYDIASQSVLVSVERQRTLCAPVLTFMFCFLCGHYSTVTCSRTQ